MKYLHSRAYCSIIHASQDTDATCVCPPRDEWIHKSWCTCMCIRIYVEGCYLAIKGNPAICDNLGEFEGIIISEISQTEEDKYGTILL